jgi:hypothetical protein
LAELRFNLLNGRDQYIGFHALMADPAVKNLPPFHRAVKSARVHRHLAPFFFLMLFTTTLAAQPAASSLYGRATSAGRPLAGVTITVASPALLGVRSTTSGAGGDYFLRALPPGIYDVEFARTGFQTVLRRVRLQLADTSRLDTEMAPSDVEETVTSTTVMPTLLESPQLLTNIDAATVDRLPVGRSIHERLALAPGLPAPSGLSLVDGVLLDNTVEESIAETTVLTGAISAEYASADGGLVATITRPGGNDLGGSLRISWIEDRDTLLEGAAGGAVIEDRVWFFGAAAEGKSVAKIAADVVENHTLTLTHHDQLSGRYDGVIGSAGTIEALAAPDQWSLKSHSFISTPAAGSHSVVAGAEDAGDASDAVFFINDVWHIGGQWSLNLGVRHGDRTEPRLGGVYDFRGDGEHRLGASWSRYGAADEATVTYGWRFGTGGYARADYIRRDAEETTDRIQLHGSYDLFRLFRFGGHYTASVRGDLDVRRRAAGWFWYEPPMGAGRMTLAILQRYLASETETFFSTDLSAMYAYPVKSVMTFAKIDLVNAFDRPPFTRDDLAVARTWRASMGVKF